MQDVWCDVRARDGGDSMNIEEEIAQAIEDNVYLSPWDTERDRMVSAIVTALSPLLNRVRAEALREAARFLGTLHGEKVAANILEMYAREIEQNSEGNGSE